MEIIRQTGVEKDDELDALIILATRNVVVVQAIWDIAQRRGLSLDVKGISSIYDRSNYRLKKQHNNT